MLLVSINFLLCHSSIGYAGLPYKSLEDLYAYDESDEITVDEDVKTPEFLSKSLNLVVNQGESISLPCSVTRLYRFMFNIIFHS